MLVNSFSFIFLSRKFSMVLSAASLFLSLFIGMSGGRLLVNRAAFQ